MTPIRRAMCAWLLTSVSATASAAIVEVDFLITATAKEIHHAGTITIDPAFQPVTFHVKVHFDPYNPLNPDEERYRPPHNDIGAWGLFLLSGSAFAPTPLSDDLQPPGGMPQQSSISGSFYRRQEGVLQDPWQALPLATRTRFSFSQTWADTTGTSTSWSSRRIDFDHLGEPVTYAEFSDLTGDDVLAFYQSQIGVSYEGAFTEENWRWVSSDTSTSPERLTFQYVGDVTIHAVSVVPEPGALAMLLVGGAMVAAHIGRVRRGGRHRELPQAA